MTRCFDMKKFSIMLCAALVILTATVTAQTKYNRYNLSCIIDGDTMRVSGYCTFSDRYKAPKYLLLWENIKIKSFSVGNYRRNGDTITFSRHPYQITFNYAIPLNPYRGYDGAVGLRREGNWYPHRNNELLKANVSIKNAEGYYQVGGSQTVPSFDLYLILLPKDQYDCKAIDSIVRPFRFYRSKSSTLTPPDDYYNEFVESYTFYSTFFGDTLSQQPMNIVELGDPLFLMCQSLRDLILFGPYFYQIYRVNPDYPWISHEMAHQWWGNSIFFEYRDYALSESIPQYIKLQFLKYCGRGYDKEMVHIVTTMQQARRSLPIADIRDITPIDASIAIYQTAPYRLEQMDAEIVHAALKKLYRRHKHSIVSREVFMRECPALQDWLMSK